MWHNALVRKGSRFGLLAEGGGYEDYLAGVIFVISGDSKLMDELSPDYSEPQAAARYPSRRSLFL